MSVVHGTWTLERVYPHPPAVVFAAWADPALKVRWFDLSERAGASYRSDFRVGGQESITSPPGQDPAYGYLAEYRDIVPDERIVVTYEMSRDDRRLSISVATVQFAATTTGTRLGYTEQGAYLDGLDSSGSRQAGAGTQLDRLAALLR